MISPGAFGVRDTCSLLTDILKARPHRLESQLCYCQVLSDTTWEVFISYQPRFSNIPTPTRCPAIWFNSDNNYTDLASNNTGLRAQSHKTTLTSDASCKYQATHPSDWPVINREFPHPHLRFDHLLERLTELRKLKIGRASCRERV